VPDSNAGDDAGTEADETAPPEEPPPTTELEAVTTTTTTSTTIPTTTTTTTTTDVDHGRLLRDRTYRSTSARQDGGRAPIADGRAVSVQFEGRSDDDVVRWRIDCNAAGASVAIGADRLTIEMGGSTVVGCDEEREEEDRWIAGFFGSDPHWSLDGDRLTLRSGGTVIELHEVDDEAF
jgi:heat shock protein HslJ